MKKWNPIQKFALYGGLCIIGLSLALGAASSWLLRKYLQESEWADTAEIVRYQVEEHHLAALFSDPRVRREPEKYQEALGYLLKLPEVVRIKLWDKDAQVVWSNDKQLIGQRFPENEETREALAGQVASKLKRLAKADREYARKQFSRLAEIYVPIRAASSGEILGVVEVYKEPRRLFAEISKVQAVIWGIASAGGLLLYLVLVPIVRRVYGSQLELEAKLREHTQDLETMVQYRTQRLMHLNTLSQLVASSLDEQPVFDYIVRAATELFPDSAATLWILDEATGDLRSCASQGARYLQMQKVTRFRLGEGVMGEAVASGQLVIGREIAEDPRFMNPEWARAEGFHSAAWVPLIREKRSLGALSVLGRFDRDFTPGEVEILTAFATQAAIAIGNARLYDTTARRARQLATLNQLTRTLTAELDPRRVGEDILAAVQVMIPGSVGRLWEVTEDEQVLRLVASAGLRDPQGGSPVRLHPGKGLIGIAAATKQPVTSQDVTADPRFLSQAWAAAEGLVACVMLPLLQGERVTGALAIYTRRAYIFGDDEIGLLESFTAQVAISLEKARLFAATERAAREVRSLYDVAHSLATSLDLTQVLRLISVKTTELLGTPHAQVVLWDAETLTLRLGAAYGTQADQVKNQQFRLGEGVNGIVAQTQAPLLVNDYQAFPYRVESSPDVLAVIGVPLLFRGRLLGVLTTHATQPGWQFTQEHLALLTSFADQAATAIENARLHEAVQRHAADLEARVKERTVELEEALRVKVEFLDRMSHELRTPLNFILGFSELMQRGTGGPLTPKQAHYLEHIHTGGKRLLELITDILNLSQIEAGKSRLHLEAIPLDGLVRDALDPLQVSAIQKRLSITTDLDPELSQVVADRDKLTQILANLIGNAVKFTPESGRIMVTARQATEDRRPESGGLPRPPTPVPCLEIAVIDTGIGMAAEDLERIFEAFHQVDGSKTRAYGGAGIGLALVRTLVGLHGGRVWAESPGPGKGSRFVVRLPLLEIPRAPRILVVEDEVTVLEALSTTLKSAGYDVDRAGSGAQAFERLTGQRPDVLVLDVGLPDVDGWDVLRRLRGTEDTRALPVLVLTGLEHVHAEQALALGADEFLAKPVSARVLVDTVTRLLTRPAVAGASVSC